MASVRGESSGSSRVISPLETTAWTTPERAKPRTSAHKISHVIPKAMLRACATPPPIDASTITTSPVRRVARRSILGGSTGARERGRCFGGALRERGTQSRAGGEGQAGHARSAHRGPGGRRGADGGERRGVP